MLCGSYLGKEPVNVHNFTTIINQAFFIDILEDWRRVSTKLCQYIMGNYSNHETL